MQILHKYEITLRNKKPNNLREKLFGPKKVIKYVWATCVINSFRDHFNQDIFDILSIKPTNEKMEFFGGNGLIAFKDNS